MTAPAFKYRLQPLLDGKLQRREDAERKVATSQNELQAEQQHLAQLEDRVRELIGRKSVFRGALLSGPAALSGHDAGFRRDHLRGLEQDVEAARDAVFSQKLVIDEVQERLTHARRELAERSREVEVLEKHRDRLRQRFQHEVERKETVEQDEIGNMLYLGRRRAK